MIEQIETGASRILGFRLSRKLHDEDYKTFVPMIDAALAAEGSVRIFVQLEDFHGWDMHALWDDIQFAAGHYSNIDRIAIVGDRKWEEWMASVCKPFTRASLRYFDELDVDSAWNWIREGIAQPGPEARAA